MDATQIIYSGPSKVIQDIFNNGTQPINTEQTEKTENTFDTIYKSAIGLIESTNSYVQDAQQAEIDFALGNLTSTHELGVIQQKANISLQYTVAIRDKLLDAYKEIMNMQI